jgi:hypothetical protein
MTTVVPAITMLLLRPAPALASTESVTAPLPFPFGCPVIRIQSTGIDADQVQPVSVWTVSVIVPPCAGTLTLVGVTENVQGAGS